MRSPQGHGKIQPLLKYQDTAKSKGVEHGWHKVTLQASVESNDHHDLPAIEYEVDQASHNDLEIERLGQALKELQEENDRLKSVSSDLYSMAVDKFNR